MPHLELSRGGPYCSAKENRECAATLFGHPLIPIDQRHLRDFTSSIICFNSLKSRDLFIVSISLSYSDMRIKPVWFCFILSTVLYFSELKKQPRHYNTIRPSPSLVSASPSFHLN
jgi:hypothetical protein